MSFTCTPKHPYYHTNKTLKTYNITKRSLRAYIWEFRCYFDLDFHCRCYVRTNYVSMWWSDQKRGKALWLPLSLSIWSKSSNHAFRPQLTALACQLCRTKSCSKWEENCQPLAKLKIRLVSAGGWNKAMEITGSEKVAESSLVLCVRWTTICSKNLDSHLQGRELKVKCEELSKRASEHNPGFLLFGSQFGTEEDPFRLLVIDRTIVKPRNKRTRC